MEQLRERLEQWRIYIETLEPDARPEALLDAGAELRAMCVQLAGCACEACGGRGTRRYSSTALWRRGQVAGMQVTDGVCDGCWGTGRSDKQGPDLRAAELEIANARALATGDWFAGRVGANLSLVREHFGELARRLRRIRVKTGDSFWFHNVAEIVAATLEDLAKARAADEVKDDD